MNASLGHHAAKLVTSFVYSHDVVSRLSLGSVKDLKNAALWLCDANENKEGKKSGEGYAAVTSRARKWKGGTGSAEDPEWASLGFSLTSPPTNIGEFSLLQYARH